MASLNIIGRQRIAAMLIPADAAKANHENVDGHDATRFWSPTRGGGSIIVGGDGSFLFASSSIAPEHHVAEWGSGRRTDPAALTSR